MFFECYNSPMTGEQHIRLENLKYYGSDNPLANLQMNFLFQYFVQSRGRWVTSSQPVFLAMHWAIICFNTCLFEFMVYQINYYWIRYYFIKLCSWKVNIYVAVLKSCWTKLQKPLVLAVCRSGPHLWAAVKCCWIFSGQIPLPWLKPDFIKSVWEKITSHSSVLNSLCNHADESKGRWKAKHSRQFNYILVVSLFKKKKLFIIIFLILLRAWYFYWERHNLG